VSTADNIAFTIPVDDTNIAVPFPASWILPPLNSREPEEDIPIPIPTPVISILLIDAYTTLIDVDPNPNPFTSYNESPL